ncbi:MAG: tetratricopeptide repeat protein [Actinomycetota bacterium]
MVQANCERCGEPILDGARFCPNCGLAVGAPPPEERKVVTVIFVDLVGSSRLSTQLDPERYREVVAAFYRVVSEELEALRGRAFNFAGDAVVGVFGIPHSHDDDALRAVRAGLSLVGRIERVGETLGLPGPLSVRVGINTGSVAIGAENSEQGLLFGATVNFAARLQEATEPGKVLVAERTWLLTRAQVEYGDAVELDAKGFEVGRAWPVRALAPGTSRRTIPMVDRKRELRLLHDTFEGAVETRRGHLVSLLGETGIGKSRVTDEFLAGLPEDTKVLIGRASKFEEDIAFAPLAQILLQELEEPANAPPERLLARLEQLTAECCPPDEVQQVVARLALALGIGLGQDARNEQRRYQIAEIRSGLVAFLDGLSRRAPVVLVFEDAHLAQPSMLDLIEQVVRDAKRFPLLVLCVARYELLDERPDWGGGLGDSLNLYLDPMSVEDAILLAREAGEGIDGLTAERVAVHAGGNPFFIVELLGMLRHVDAHLPSDTDALPEQLLPPTVQAVIAARIDHLVDPARDLVRKASVFARTSFEVSDLALIADPDVEVLDLLEDEELLVRDGDRPGRWRFRHGLVRDVAYESLPKRERLRLHVLVAEGLAGDEERAGRYPRSIAYHLERAARAGLDLDPGDRALAERAREALARAGDLALQASDGRAAADLYGRALVMSGPERAWGPREAEILSNLGEARYWQGEFESAAPALQRALDLDGGNEKVRAQASRLLGDIELSIRGDRERAAELFAQALAASRELADPWSLARTLLVAGWEPYWRGDLEASRAMFGEALEVVRSNPEGDPWAESRALVTLATIEAEDGDEEQVLALASQALAIAEGSGDRFSIAVARENVGGSLRRMDRLDEALTHLDTAVGTYRQLGARWEVASALTARGVTHRIAGRAEQAVADLREAYRLCRELNDRSILGWTAGMLARSLADLGEFGAARDVLAEVSQIPDASGAVQVDWLLDSEVEILLTERDVDGAREKAGELLALRREHGTPKDLAAAVWWIGAVFGADAVGGEDELERARELLESWHSYAAIRRPERMLAFLQG